MTAAAPRSHSITQYQYTLPKVCSTRKSIDFIESGAAPNVQSDFKELCAVSEPRLDFLNHEPVSGQLLSERLAAGALSLDETLRYAIELGTAIGGAHARGVVHGAVCPQSIAITAGGMRLLEPQAAQDHDAYRAPEQLQGQSVDQRSDVFAFGAVVYEMACGQRAFSASGADLRRAILSQRPAPLAADSPAGEALEAVIGGCLEKDPARRRQRIQSAVGVLKLAARGVRRDEAPLRPIKLTEPQAPAPRPQAAIQLSPSPPAPPPLPSPLLTPDPSQPWHSSYRVPIASLIPANPFQRRIWIMGAAALTLAASGLAAAVLLNRHPARPVLKFSVSQPEHTSYPGMPAVSPDGRYLTFSAVGPEGRRMLWLRPLDALHAAVVAGSEGASAPFWSPDSQYIAFFAARNLMRVKITGGTPEKICDAEASPGGGAWHKDGTILFSPSLSDGFYRVAASGGKPQLVLKVDEAKNEHGDLWPQFLPDGKHFIFYRQTGNADTSGVYAGSVEAASVRQLFSSQTNAVYSPAANSARNGYLLYIQDRNLMAVPFNAGKLELTGEPIILANDIGAVRSLSLAPISISANGVLVYQGVGRPTRQMVWLDRAGRQLAVSGEPGEYGPPRVAPDGNRGVVAKAGPDGKAHLWILDRSGSAEQITRGDAHEGSPVWSPDGHKIAYFTQQGNAYDLFVRVAGPEGKGEVIVKSDARKYPTDWSRDGKYILFGIEGEGTSLDVWGVSTGDRRVAPVLNTVYGEGYAAISPSGKWLAYQSDQSGRPEVYIEPFEGLSAGTRRRWQVSRGGALPRWRSDSNELFYITGDGRMMSAEIHAAGDGGIEPGTPQSLFQTRPIPKTLNLYDVSPDGQRFLFNVPLEWTSSNPITVVTNWTEKLRDY